jgi:hypothetical protein
MRSRPAEKILFRSVLIPFLATAMAAGAIWSQADPASVFGEIIQQNQERLRQYEWTSTVRVTVAGREMRRRTDLVRYDPDGNLKKTPIGGNQAGKKKQQQKMDELGVDLRARIEPYIHPVTGEWKRFFEISSAWEGLGPKAGLIQVEADNYRIEEDYMKIRLDAGTGLPRTFLIRTYFEGLPVSVITEFRDILDGPAYPARTVIRVVARQMEITIENFDHIKQGG